MRTAADPTTASVAGSRRSLGAAVDVREVTQITHGRTTLHDVSFSVAPGEVVAIVWGQRRGEDDAARDDGRHPATGLRRGAHRRRSLPVGRSATFPRTTSSTANLPLACTFCTPRSSDCPPTRRRTPSTGLSTPRRSPRSTSPSGGPCAAGSLLRRPAQAGEHRGGDAHPTRRVLPGRADVRAGSGDCPRGAGGPLLVGGCRHDDRPHHAQPDRHRPLRPDRVPRSRRVPGVRGDAARGSAALRHGRSHRRLRTPRRSRRRRRHGRGASLRSGGAATTTVSGTCPVRPHGWWTPRPRTGRSGRTGPADVTRWPSGEPDPSASGTS